MVDHTRYEMRFNDKSRISLNLFEIMEWYNRKVMVSTWRIEECEGIEGGRRMRMTVCNGNRY